MVHVPDISIVKIDEWQGSDMEVPVTALRFPEIMALNYMSYDPGALHGCNFNCLQLTMGKLFVASEARS